MIPLIDVRMLFAHQQVTGTVQVALPVFHAEQLVRPPHHTAVPAHRLPPPQLPAAQAYGDGQKAAILLPLQALFGDPLRPALLLHHGKINSKHPVDRADRRQPHLRIIGRLIQRRWLRIRVHPAYHIERLVLGEGFPAIGAQHIVIGKGGERAGEIVQRYIQPQLAAAVIPPAVAGRSEGGHHGAPIGIVREKATPFIAALRAARCERHGLIACIGRGGEGRQVQPRYRQAQPAAHLPHHPPAQQPRQRLQGDIVAQIGGAIGKLPGALITHPVRPAAARYGAVTPRIIDRDAPADESDVRGQTVDERRCLAVGRPAAIDANPQRAAACHALGAAPFRPAVDRVVRRRAGLHDWPY